jgi:hypothetical protein
VQNLIGSEHVAAQQGPRAGLLSHGAGDDTSGIVSFRFPIAIGLRSFKARSKAD